MATMQDSQSTEPTMPVLITHKFSSSSNILEARFDAATGEVEVDFKNGSSYKYGNFSTEKMTEWQVAKSAGGWFDANVKKKPEVHPMLLARRPPRPSESAPAAAAAPTDPPALPAAPAPESLELAVDVDKVPESVVARARGSYEAYIRNSHGLSHDGKQCPPFAELGRRVQSHWCAVAIDAMEHAQPTVELQVLANQCEEFRRQAVIAEQAAQTKLDVEVLKKTETIERDCETLRARVAELERKERVGFAPWRRDG